MKKSLLLLSAGLLTATSLFQSCKGGMSGDTVNLKMNLTPGSKYAYSMETKTNTEQSMMGQSMKMGQTMTMEFSYDVAPAEGNDRKLTVTYDHIAMKMESAMGNMEYDSKEGGKKDSILSSMGGLLNKPFSMVVSESGEIKKIEGLDAIINGMGGTGSAQEEAIRKQMSSSFNDTAMRKMMEQSFNIYPGKEVKVGDTWNKQTSTNMSVMTMKLDNTYKLTGVSNGIAHIDVVSKISTDGKPVIQGGQEMKIDLNGESKGTMDVEVASGLVTDSKMKQSIKGNVNAMGISVPMNIDNDIHITGKKK